MVKTEKENGKVTGTTIKSEKNGSPSGLKTKEKIHFIPIEQLRIKKNFNPRFIFDSEKMKQLERDIQRNGIISPLEVQYDVNEKLFYISDGERRFRCARELKLKFLPCIKLPTGFSETDLLIRAFSHGGNSESLTKIEKGKLIWRMKSSGDMSVEEIARMLSVSPTHAYNFLNVFENASQDDIENLKNGKVKFTNVLKSVKDKKSEKTATEMSEEKKQQKEEENGLKAGMCSFLRWVWAKVLNGKKGEEREEIEDYSPYMEYLLKKYEKFEKASNVKETEVESEPETEEEELEELVEEESETEVEDENEELNEEDENIEDLNIEDIENLNVEDIESIGKK